MAIIPSTNVNLATNVRDVLNAAGGSVTNDLLTFFQARANINKWSRYKPVALHRDFDLTDAEFRLANFGLSMPPYPGEWIYTLPAGGAAQPMRLGDFRGYNTAAQPPIKLEASQKNVQLDMARSMSVAAFYRASTGAVGVTSGMELAMSDLELTGTGRTIENFYWGLFYSNGADELFARFSEGPLKNTSGDTMAAVYPLKSKQIYDKFVANGGSITLHPFISQHVEGSTLYNADGTAILGNMFSFPGNPAITLRGILSAAFDVTLQGDCHVYRDYPYENLGKALQSSSTDNITTGTVKHITSGSSDFRLTLSVNNHTSGDAPLPEATNIQMKIGSMEWANCFAWYPSADSQTSTEKIKAGASTVYLSCKVPYDTFNKAYPYQGEGAQFVIYDFDIRLRMGQVQFGAAGQTSYRYRMRVIQ